MSDNRERVQASDNGEPVQVSEKMLRGVRVGWCNWEPVAMRKAGHCVEK